MKLERRATHKRMSPLKTPLNSSATGKEKNPVGSVLSRMNFGMGESKLAIIMLTIKAMIAPSHWKRMPTVFLKLECVFMVNLRK
ncbi:MAG TPA: hypothetical protein VK206_18580 [Anaerolineales bacterium]|nr:hypothetical protein [Anaerolineales bacterium]